MPVVLHTTHCDFVVWTNQNILIERLYPDMDFWLEHITHVKHFFDIGILPDLVGKFLISYTLLVCSTSIPKRCSFPVVKASISSLEM